MVQEENGDNEREAKKVELLKTREELKKAKETAIQSWLDSKPIIDKLERSKSRLASVKVRVSTSNNAVTELEFELENIGKIIRSKRAEELRTRRRINKISTNVNHTRKGLERLKLDIAEEERSRSEFKRIQQVRRYSLRTLQLTLRAVRLESEGLRASTAAALQLIQNYEMENSAVVKLTHQEYHAITKRAKEETSVADWRIMMSMEQKLAAETSRNLVLSRFRKSHDSHTVREPEIEDLNIHIAAESSQGNPQQMRRSYSNNNKKLMQKKRSILHHIKCFFISITRLFA